MQDAGGQATDIADWQTLQGRLRARGERRLVLLEGSRTDALIWLRQRLPMLLADRGTAQGVWTGPPADSPHERLNPVSPPKARQWLGRELDAVVWDGWNGNPPDSLAVLAGTLRAGGLLFWLMPPLAQWRYFEDPDYARTGLKDALEHPFAAQMASELERDPSVIRVDLTRPGRVRLPLPDLPQESFKVIQTPDQQRAIEAIVRTGRGRRRRPLVITADRGRGKSAALGMAAVALLQQGRQHVVVTAPSAKAVETLFRHARLAAGEALAENTSEDELWLSGGGRLSYLTPEQLLEQAPEAELVLVDEAAALPAERLARILTGWPRVVFASTVHGYEGSGRGFAIRFRQVLNARTPQWHGITLAMPIRWSESDPLEPLVSRLFMLSADAPDPAPNDGAVELETWAPSQAGEAELEEAFGLLVNAHYRTTPADLRQWLDDPRAVSWRLTVGGQLAGILWAVREGGLNDDLAGAVMRGQRRVRGHLLAQSLANHSGFADAAACTWLRVVRVAVSERCRGHGFGKQLVQAACEYAAHQSLDGVGTSFGGTAALLGFWQRAGLTLARPGMTREASTGEYPVQMLKGTSLRGRELLRDIRQRLREHWLTLVPLYWQEVDPTLMWQLTAELAGAGAPDELDIRDLDSFVNGHRGFDLMVPVLRKVSLWPAALTVLGASDDRNLWVRRVLQGWSWGELRRIGLCDGQADGERRLRRMAGAIPGVSGNL